MTSRLKYVHVHSIRLQSGQEALVARVITRDNREGYGFSFRLDAAEAREMAEWDAGARSERPPYEPVLGHPWEKAYLAGAQIPWDVEPAFTALEFLPPRPPSPSAATR
ncbi:MAG TPA: hypothetical protein VFU24_12280 [Burkholderiales bacterium]|nr:hypothetical protein [Burkholderiales bacterium]